MLTEKKHIYKPTTKTAHRHQHTIISRKNSHFFGVSLKSCLSASYICLPPKEPFLTQQIN